ncbi:hypothetical protein BUALT_Bualt06G0056500 [Buddleja alternifolia]|uniref:Maturase K n=1 Tax=Buddleja alternifolia TaxID=168488 RepID=A0AAV6XEG5_9LAMI|nr:hypothetical protein BUALT_Bualt06G0056500 [Buddleja alternifolia]
MGIGVGQERPQQSSRRYVLICRLSTMALMIRCLSILKQQVNFDWQGAYWKLGVQRASSEWRGKHLVNVAYRMLLASLIYMLWKERNSRLFNGNSDSPESDISGYANYKNHLVSLKLKESLQSIVFGRIWRIAW